MGEWTAELEWLFKQKESQYWQEQRALYLSNQFEYFGGHPESPPVDAGGGPLENAKEWDFPLQAMRDAQDAAIQRELQNKDQRETDILIEDLTALNARKERERNALQQLDDELAKADEQSKKDKEEQEKKDQEQKDKDEEDKKKEEEKKKQEEEAKKENGDDEDDEDDADDPEASNTETGGPAPSAMPTEDDDYVGVARKFWGDNGPIDPTDVSDNGRFTQIMGGEVPIEPWDSYDGIGEVTRIYGGDEPTPAWEKIGPKFRPTALRSG